MHADVSPVFVTAGVTPSLADAGDLWRSRESSLGAALESLHVHSAASGKGQWLEARSQLGPPMAYTNGTSRCNGRPVDPERVKCVGNYEATSEYSDVSKRRTIFSLSKLTCAGEWKVDVEEISPSEKYTITASCAGIFRDTASIIMTFDNGTTSTLMDYHCAFGFTYSAEVFFEKKSVKYRETIGCRMSEFCRVLANRDEPSGSDEMENSMKELTQQVGRAFIPKEPLNELPKVDAAMEQQTASQQTAGDDSSTECARIVTCNKLPASEYQPCRGDFEEDILCARLTFQEYCQGKWAPFIKGATCKGTWSIYFWTFSATSSFQETMFCNGNMALAVEHIKIRGHEFSGSAESCFGTAGIGEVGSIVAPGPAPGPGPQWQVDAIENEVLQTLEVSDEREYEGFGIS